MAALPHAIGAALLAPVMPARPVRPARVIKLGGRTPTKVTQPIRYTQDQDTAAWYAELRAAQAVR